MLEYMIIDPNEVLFTYKSPYFDGSIDVTRGGRVIVDCLADA